MHPVPETFETRPSSPGRPRVRIRLWHFVVLPAAAMGCILLLTRLVETWFAGRLAPTTGDLYNATKFVLIVVVMASLMAWLAVRYRRQYEAALRARNKDLEDTRDFLAKIIEGSGEAIVALDASDRVMSWNRAAESMFGYSAEEMLGQSVRRLLPDDPVVQAERERVGDELRSGRTVRDHQTTRLRKDGQSVTVRVTWSPLLDPHDRYAGCTGIVLDVTAEMEMRERLLERERLAAVGELAAQVAHEIRNPLAGIRGACEVVFSGRATDAMRQEIGGEVVSQIDRLNRTVNELLLFARPRPLEPSGTDVHALIDRVVTLIQEDPASAGVELQRRYASDLPEIHADRAQLEQVFYNILLNASQILDHKGSIIISTACRDHGVEIAVRDTGPGISPKVRHTLFQPFVSTRAKGTGLGLAIVRKIVEAHYGTVEAVNVPGGGAEFRLRLPLELPAPALDGAGRSRDIE